MSAYKAQYDGVSRNGLLRVIASLHADLENANRSVAVSSQHLVRFNLHMAHAEEILRDLHDDPKVGRAHKARIRRAFDLAQISEASADAPPEQCPDCQGDIRHAGEGWHVCDAGCGFRSLHEQPTPEGG
jgi:hypothetical protein